VVANEEGSPGKKKTLRPNHFKGESSEKGKSRIEIPNFIHQVGSQIEFSKGKTGDNRGREMGKTKKKPRDRV